MGHLLFLIYINDIDGDIVSKISKVVDDTKLCGQSQSEAEAKILMGLRNRDPVIFNWFPAQKSGSHSELSLEVSPSNGLTTDGTVLLNWLWH